MERRTVSGYVLNAVMNRVEQRDKMLREAQGKPRAGETNPVTTPEC